MSQLYAIDKFLEKYHLANGTDNYKTEIYIYEIKLSSIFSNRKSLIKMFVLVNSGKLSNH